MEDSNMKTTRFTVNFQDFINWFFNGDFQDGFTYKNFKSSIKMLGNDEDINCIDIGTTWNDLSDRFKLYTVYGQLRAVYETGRNVTFKVYSGGDDNGGRIDYVLVFRCHVIRFISWNKHPAYTWEITARKKPVLCLESKPRLFKQAIAEIKDAIAMRYYCDSEGNIMPEEFCGEYEVRVDWMHYKSGCSPEYLQEHANYGAGDLCDQSIMEALAWFRTGFEQGILSDGEGSDYVAVIKFDK